MIPYADLEAIFLDAGNTLVAIDAVLLCQVLAGHGVVCGPAALARAEAASRPALSDVIAAGPGSGWEDIFVFHVRSILDAVGAQEVEGLARRVVTDLRQNVPTQRLWSSVMPGVPEALTRLREAGLRLIVVSNSDGTCEQGLIDRGLRAQVDHVVDSFRVGVEKPDRRIFEHALAVSGTAPERTLHVGDLYAVDVVGARAAGVHAVLLDPHDDWPEVDCERFPDLGALADAIVGAR